MRLGTRTVREELEARRGSRYGLSGVKVTIRSHDGEFIIDSTQWNAERKLVLVVYPADGPEPVHLNCKKTAHCSERTHSSLCFETTWPPGILRDVPAADCVLMSTWPIACCRLGRRRVKRLRGSRADPPCIDGS
jgi:hypothetical protein